MARRSTAGASRRETVAAMRREQQRKERRKTLLVVGVAGVVGLGLITAGLVPYYLSQRNDPVKKDTSDFGVALSAASCDPITNDPVSGGGEHVGPNTGSPNDRITHVDYDTVPPSSGKHFLLPQELPRNFYSAADRPPMEQLVHRLEHGYSILWYTSDAPKAEVAELEDLAKNADARPETQDRFIASAWDDSYGKFPAGKHFALSHWGAKQGHRQLCGKLSGEAVDKFVKAYPYTDAPEPGAV